MKSNEEVGSGERMNHNRFDDRTMNANEAVIEV